MANSDDGSGLQTWMRHPYRITVAAVLSALALAIGFYEFGFNNGREVHESELAAARLAGENSVRDSVQAQISSAEDRGRSLAREEYERQLRTETANAIERGRQEGFSQAIAALDVERKEAARKAYDEGVVSENTRMKAELAAAVEQAYRRGVTETELSYNASNQSTASFLKALETLISSDGVGEILPSGAQEKFVESLGAARSGDFDTALKTLPGAVELNAAPSCLKNDVVVTFRSNDFIDHCESGAEIVFKGYSNSGSQTDIWVSVDGTDRRLFPGNRAQLSDTCWLTFLRTDGDGVDRVPNLRASCM